jgi:hypothetical protein
VRIRQWVAPPGRTTNGPFGAPFYNPRMERQDLSDRRFDVLLERLDRIGDELAKLNRRADNDENFLRLTREIASLNESLQALAYAALGQQAPHVRRKRTG